VFKVLLAHQQQWQKEIKSKVTIDQFVFHYMGAEGEDLSELEKLSKNVWGFITRPKVQPEVTELAGIRSHFEFEFFTEGDTDYVRMRELSCHCDGCFKRCYELCVENIRGKPPPQYQWTKIEVTKRAGATLSSQKSLPSNRRNISKKRRKLAEACKKGEIVALEAKDDAYGHRFWLAEVTDTLWTYCGSTKIDRQAVDGRVVRTCKKISGGQYITVRIVERCPADSSTNFKQEEDEQDWEVDAEAVIARRVQLTAERATRGNPLAGAFCRNHRLGKEEATRIESAAEESFQQVELENKESVEEKEKPSEPVKKRKAEKQGKQPAKAVSKKQKKSKKKS
jgi:hypothetical protein